MGFGGIGPVQLIIILVIVLLIFGTKKLRNFGGDLGGAIKGFKKAVKEEENPELDNENKTGTEEVSADTATAQQAKKEESPETKKAG
ncbi:MAG: twin-arginine translocase TatA/TatE family subunit [Gammaproteobacteria bacterium]|nr:twin-arginine translocase TatA/TatE family subunit [Gammaproteobacteria bacterium]